jgi:hypothetical protein
MCDQKNKDVFKELITRHKRNVDDYDFFLASDPPRMSDTYPTSGRITLVNKKEGKTRTYRTGHWSDWVKELENDLDKGLI